MEGKGIILFNPRSADKKHRVPNSVLQVAASVYEYYPVEIIDGNLENDPWKKLEELFLTGNYFVFGCTVMPGPQLKQAIPFTKRIKEKFPHIITVWGGYFASNQFATVIHSGFVDYIINGNGDLSFPQLVNMLSGKEKMVTENIPNLIYRNQNEVVKTKKAPVTDPDELTVLPYGLLEKNYPLENYLGKTFLGKKTIAYHSSFGCPFTCSFCAVVPIYEARWKGRSAQKMYEDILFLKEKYGIDAIEFHDNNFFTSAARVVEFSRLVKDLRVKWWGEGRIDTLNKYKDEELQLMKEAGCEMIFLGAETGNDDLLKQMDKGGTQTGKGILEFADRMKKVGIIPEFSFVLGFPGKNENDTWRQIKEDVEFIRKIKKINPGSEIIIYVYSPVPVEGSELYEKVKATGFVFPEKLEDWLDEKWIKFDLRKNPFTPWLTPSMISYIKNFETVLNGYYPTVSDTRIRNGKRKTLRAVSALRYTSGFYSFPLEIKFLHKIWKYRQPEEQGFYAE